MRLPLLTWLITGLVAAASAAVGLAVRGSLLVA